MIRALLATLVIAVASTAAAQSDTDRRLRETEAMIAARKEHANAVHEQQRAAREVEQAAVCRASYPERLEDARRAITQRIADLRAGQRSGAASTVAWFDSHCRFLSELEIAIRKLDDPNAFVCDTAKGRPPQLTSTLVLRYATPATVADYQERRIEDRACEPFDAAERESLVLESAP